MVIYTLRNVYFGKFKSELYVKMLTYMNCKNIQQNSEEIHKCEIVIENNICIKYKS